jgi:transcriptional accessory protein Tex/SPT6
MNIAKLLALILSFQASVQAVTLKDLYRQYTKEHKTQDAAAIETKLEQLEKWGIDPNTEIRGNLDWTHSLAEKYLFHIDKGNTEDAAEIEKKIAMLNKWGIDPNTVLHQPNDGEKTLARMYAFHIDKGNTEDAADIEKKLQY